MNNYIGLGDLIKSISITHNFDKDKLVFLNTSDVLAGKILISHYTPISKLKGQAKKTIQNGDILYSEIRPKNKRYAYVKNIQNTEDYIVSTKLMVLRNCSVKLDTDYLYHFLTYDGTINYLQKRAENRIGSFPQITFDIVKTIKIWLPELIIQKQIAKVLGDLDAKIEINNKINAELEGIAKTIYNYWFVQFDFPDANGKPYKASGGKMVYNENLKKEIPEGWQDKTIADWIEKDKSGDWGKDSAQGNYTEQVSCIRGADINGLNGNGVVKAPERFILEKNTHKQLEEGDLIIEISGGSPTQSTGRMAFITQETLERFENPLICSNFCKAVTLKDETYLYNFVYQWQRLYDAGVLFGWEGKTSGIKNLLFESFVTNYKTVFPKKDIVEKFYQKIKPIHAKKQKNLRENQKLADLRDWLLPMLMNGQVTVKEAKEHINQAAEPQEVYKK
ncbi:restriction endonuclease subunit S [Tenacibaculum sp. 1_MG-2023]|uniref:restriction endonuclease subunit S n=1 Tax=Tenacibaculum sp. 1_MG-2023 TaxID=3062653 RepID=UPI0026E1C771|nr:restriction endonuclease subunit S [Tenacibaculum sp. 1_MG-2023]MDO6600646.1 restriction endonuclease subunit S [Tenacibaculum sp. 1_MG-2023]